MKSKLRKEAKTQSSTATTTTTSTPSELSFAIARIAVSQICQSVGFKATQLSALETLTLVATKYLQAIAGSATSFTNSSNRTQSNLLDLTNALHEVVSLHSGGLSGGSILHRPTSTLLSTSGVLKDLANFVYFHDEIPFAKPIPRPDRTSSSGNSSPGTKKLDCTRGSHVPKWLPGFPNGNNGVDEIYLGKGKRKNGESLWEESVLVGSDLGRKNWNENGRKRVAGEGKVETGRGKVRFKMGSMSGVCRLENNKNNLNDRSNGIDKEEKILVYKRRRRRRDDGGRLINL
ncbi:transcription initiation factor TFIID subunit 8 [Carya illinoinensis]|uniref:Bromodomain associated domain-containing protein n=1 Tax=Carya illinoinensis TaxID=32201 RepID=A0A8T1PI91_CARIL|nr:transcription initiation factor TFIID subunit 8 [Carya illinoinensis]KAG6641514.1 hypothetical protein CIPAW_09G078900 [Carya illinoinensis]